ncbi:MULTISPECIES: hypothetical protein [Curtobacterium]|uniref:hypothetical protein n=1 Tax=Curtobacterium TaxID=2034 RepID=UPI00217CEBCC|nr:hypothetical protein [Curtobacterium flaccumfaciens]MCS6581603.1 hypothetical protein [Curtobacterium flaccumfaciens pv. beticola]MCS6587709.1 hypothetical protein [Curtobacterium flaccumfaciens pv. flaccumfaciens]
MSIKNVVLGAVVLGSVAGGGIAVDTVTAPEASAACYGSVSIWKGKNNSCSSARQWDAIKNKDPRYGKWVTRGNWSQQTACWANVVSYGMTARS